MYIDKVGTGGVCYLLDKTPLVYLSYFKGRWWIDWYTTKKKGNGMKTLKKRGTERVKLPAGLTSLGITLVIPKQPKCRVVDCFTDQSVFVFRNADFDNLLPQTLSASGKVSVVGYELTRFITEAKLAQVEGGRFTNLRQIEDLILRTERGESTGLLTTNNYTNIFFMEVGTFVLTVRAHRRNSGVWDAYPYPFSPWMKLHGGHRFFSIAT